MRERGRHGGGHKEACAPQTTVDVAITIHRAGKGVQVENSEDDIVVGHLGILADTMAVFRHLNRPPGNAEARGDRLDGHPLISELAQPFEIDAASRLARSASANIHVGRWEAEAMRRRVICRCRATAVSNVFPNGPRCRAATAGRFSDIEHNALTAWISASVAECHFLR